MKHRRLTVIIKNNFKLLRTKAGLSQYAAAKGLKATASLITHIENGKCNMSLEMAIKACKLFGCRPEELLYVDYSSLNTQLYGRQGN